MFDDALITLWSLWPVILFWVLLALLILGLVLAGLHLMRIQIPNKSNCQNAWLKAATWVPVFGGGIYWGLTQWLAMSL